MSWIKIDDQFADHPKVVQAGPLASWLYVCGLTYAGRYLTDGWIPTAQVRKLADVDDAAALAARLVAVGLWEQVAGGYKIHDYHDYNPTALKVKADRAAAAKRQADWRDGHRDEAGQYQSGDTTRNAVSNGVTDDEVTSAPSPSPSPSPSPCPIPDPSLAGATAPAATPPTPAEPQIKPVVEKKPNIRSDPRSKTPAIQCVSAICDHRYPPRAMFDTIISTLGDTPDGVKLKKCRQEWVERGYNASSWKWLTEWYVTGIPTKNGARASPPRGGTVETDPDVWARDAENAARRARS